MDASFNQRKRPFRTKFKLFSPFDESKEEVVDVDITMVVSVTIFISSIVNEIRLEKEILESLISKIYKKRQMKIIIYPQKGNFHRTIKAQVIFSVLSRLAKVSNLSLQSFLIV